MATAICRVNEHINHAEFLIVILIVIVCFANIFLKNIAKTKTFDISGSGKNSIECLRESKAYDVLIWASEEKDYNIAVSRDMKLNLAT